MKKVLLATIAVFGVSTAAYAEGFGLVGETEYAFEADVFSLEAGTDYNRGDFNFVALTKFDNDSVGDDFEFSGAELEVGYSINKNVTGYVRVEVDDDFDYDETVVGASFDF